MTNQTQDLFSKWYWLSGASTGMGLAIAQQLAARGASLIIMSRNITHLEDARKTLRVAAGAEIVLAPLDIADDATPARALQILGPRKLSGILLNGGGPHGGKASEVQRKDLDLAHRLLLSGPVCLLNAPLTCRAPLCSVVAITSTTVKEIHSSLTLSGTYRTALVSFLKNLSNELAGQGVRINNIAPGYVATDRLKVLGNFIATQQFGTTDESKLEKIYEDWANKSPMQRIGHPDEIAEVAMLLFSEKALFLNGQTIVVDGGQLRTY